MLHILNAIYPAFLILLAGFIGAIFLYVFLKLISQDIDITIALLFVLLLFIAPILVVIKVISYIFFENNKIKNMKIHRKVSVFALFFPYVLIKFFSNPAKHVNSLADNFCHAWNEAVQLGKKPIYEEKTFKGNSSMTLTFRTLLQSVKFLEDKFLTSFRTH